MVGDESLEVLRAATSLIPLREGGRWGLGREREGDRCKGGGFFWRWGGGGGWEEGYKVSIY